jgi:hypothetical protein
MTVIIVWGRILTKGSFFRTTSIIFIVILIVIVISIKLSIICDVIIVVLYIQFIRCDYWLHVVFVTIC